MATPIPPYGVAIQDAIASGDLARMQTVADEAERYLREFGEIGDGLKALKRAIAQQGGQRALQPLYAPAIQAAIASGDIDNMRDVAQQAESMLRQADAVRSALEDLQGTISGTETGNG